MSVSALTSVGNLLPMLHRTDATLTGSSTNAAIAADLVFWTKKELLRWFDEAVKDLANKAVIFVRRDTATSLVAGTATYAAPSRHLRTLYAAHSNRGLRPSSTYELEALDTQFASASGTPTKFYEDKIGANIIGLYKVPASGDVAAGALEIIQSEYPTEVDELEVNTAVAAPAVFGDLWEARVLTEAYNKDSDARLPEVAANLGEFTQLIESVISGLWGTNR